MYEIMKAINNYFIYKMESGTYSIETDGIVGNFGNTYVKGMYIVINGSYLNDGLYKVDSATSNKITVEETLTVENTGETMVVANCKVPNEFISLVAEITTWNTNNAKNAGVASEKIDDYSISYDKSGSGDTISWMSAFSSRLAAYRKMYNTFETSPPRNRYARCR